VCRKREHQGKSSRGSQDRRRGAVNPSPWRLAAPCPSAGVDARSRAVLADLRHICRPLSVSLSFSMDLTADGHTVGSGFVLTAGKRDTPPFFFNFFFGSRRISRPLRAVSTRGSRRVSGEPSRFHAVFSQISADPPRFHAVYFRRSRRSSAFNSHAKFYRRALSSSPGLEGTRVLYMYPPSPLTCHGPRGGGGNPRRRPWLVWARQSIATLPSSQRSRVACGRRARC